MDGLQYVAVRSLHVLAAAFLFGGPLGMWLAFRTAEAVPVRLLSWIELLFWGAISVIVFTGLGNLSAFGVPTVETTTGAILGVKFGAIALLVVGSVPRTFVVIYAEQDGTTVHSRALEWGYGLTAVGVAAIVFIAGVLVRG